MYPESFYNENRKQEKPRDPLTLDIYPSTKKKTSFELIEDDGLTYLFKSDSQFKKTLIVCDAIEKINEILISVKSDYEGNGYNGMPQKRNYLFSIHIENPKRIYFKNHELLQKDNLIELNESDEGWCYTKDEKILNVKIRPQNHDDNFTLQIIKL